MKTIIGQDRLGKGTIEQNFRERRAGFPHQAISAARHMPLTVALAPPPPAPIGESTLNAVSVIQSALLVLAEAWMAAAAAKAWRLASIPPFCILATAETLAHVGQLWS